ncbi:cytochrome P450 [Jimgerdemannia flammicorona]|uniref:Cytochrome P450 n=1 Tax=Jimgerdemannia flammicorona TaxID=994334 RepID=A0A433D4G6_9FUNG|nr:cytochrome P450 [Jimgerdemannia flammicorona]
MSYSLSPPTFLPDWLLPPASSLHHRPSISVAVAAVVAGLGLAYYVYADVLELNKPAGWRAVPRISGLAYTASLVAGMSIPERYGFLFRDVLLKHGLARGNLGISVILTVGDPDMARQVLNNIDDFPKMTTGSNRPDDLISRFFGTNLVSSNGVTWRRQRRIANPAFHRGWNTEIFAERAGVLVENIRRAITTGEDEVEMVDMFQRLTLDVLGKAVFGYNFAGLENPNSEYIQIYNEIVKLSGQPINLFFPFITQYLRPGLDSKIVRFDDMLYRIIDHKREEILRAAAERGGQPMTPEEEKGADLLALMLQACNAEEEGRRMDRKELRDNMMAFFIAGYFLEHAQLVFQHDTTSSAFSSAFYELATQPVCFIIYLTMRNCEHIQTTARAEILSVLGPNPASAPTTDQLKLLPYLDAVIKETLRLYPPLPTIAFRKAARDVPLVDVTRGKRYVVPRGTLIAASAWHLGRNSAVWGHDAAVFRPERWIEEPELGRRAGWNYLPFSNGTRSSTRRAFCAPYVPPFTRNSSTLAVFNRIIFSRTVREFEWTLPADSLHADGLVFTEFNALKSRPMRIVFRARG